MTSKLVFWLLNFSSFYKNVCDEDKCCFCQKINLLRFQPQIKKQTPDTLTMLWKSWQEAGHSSSVFPQPAMKHAVRESWTSSCVAVQHVVYSNPFPSELRCLVPRVCVWADVLYKYPEHNQKRRAVKILGRRQVQAESIWVKCWNIIRKIKRTHFDNDSM